MATLSFSVEFSPGTAEYEPPMGGYTIELHGDQATPSDDEYDCVMAHTARAFVRIARNPASAFQPMEMAGDKSALQVLQSAHYTWRVERSDRKPMMPQELQFSFTVQVMNRLQEKRQREPIIAFPLTALKRLLEADKGERDAFVAALAEISPMDQEVGVEDQVIAAGLVSRGLMTTTDAPGRYLLRNIEVQ